MAESNFTTPLQGSYLIQPPPGPPPQIPEFSAGPLFQPAFPNHGPYSHESSGYSYCPPAHYGTSLSDRSQGGPGSFQYHQPRFYQQPFSAHMGYRAPGFYHGTPGLADGLHGGMNSASPPDSVPNTPMSGSLYGDFTETRHPADLLPMMEPTLSGNAQVYRPTQHSQISPHHMHYSIPGRRSRQVSPTLPSLQPVRFGGEAVPVADQGRGPMRGVSASSDQTRHFSLLHRRQSYDRQVQPHIQPPSAIDRRGPPTAFLAQTHRSDRSVSPRTSNRRSFDRYSTDLPPASNPAEADEAAMRARTRPRRERARPLPRQAHFVVEGNTPTAHQMQALRDKLRHFLPSELPKGSSACCDICQKDFSSKHCLPTEEDEVAIQLPCKHIFGEHCINTWFDTCKTHKNKITCPMCRKLLIEPLRSPAALLTAMPEMISILTRTMDRGGGLSSLSLPEQQAIMELARARASEGDF